MGIYREKEIRAAYSGLPKLRVRDLLFGDIINWTPDPIAWWPPIAAGEEITQRVIIGFQGRQFRPSPRIFSTHSLFHLFDGVCWNVTTPRPGHVKLEDGKLDPNKAYIVCRYKDFRITTAEERLIIYDGIGYFGDSAYDIPQLLSIFIHEFLGFPEEDYYHFFDPRRWTVCSPAVRGLWVGLWQAKGGEASGYRRPGGKLHVERTPPALMENHETFEVVGVLEGGLCG